MACPSENATIKACDFTSFLVHQTPVYDKLVVQSIRPTDGWIGHVKTGTFPAYSGVEHTLDRFEHVWPDTTQTWKKVQAGNCLGNPCDPTEHVIGWGSSRITYALRSQSWQTPLLCFDNDMHITHARDQFRQIITDILRPATSAIMSQFLRKAALYYAGRRYVATTDFGTTAAEFSLAGSDENMGWTTDANGREIYLITSKKPTLKLTPQMLQRRVHPLMMWGYFGRQPFKDMPPLIELVLGMETAWELDRQVSGSNIGDRWRYQDWGAANKYWRYGFSGQLGNYAVRVDPMALRFNYCEQTSDGKYKFQLIPPYVNVTAGGAPPPDQGKPAGLKSQPNPDYENAAYEMGFVWHRQGMECLVADATPVNPTMPYSSRNFGGRWQFAMDNLGADANGVAIENKRRNKGQFIADFKLAIRPLYTEFVEAWFYKREAAPIVGVDTCGTDPSCGTQNYGSQPSGCS